MNNNMPIEKKVKGYGYLHSDGEFEFTPVRKGVNTGKMRIVKQTKHYTYYEGREHGKISIMFDKEIPIMLLFNKMIKAVEDFIMYYRKHK